MSVLKNSIWRTIKEYVLIAFGIFLYVFAWSLFLATNNLVGGGVTGIGSIVQYATHGVIKIGYTYFALNVILIAIALKVLGKSFGAKTIFAMVLASIGLNVFQDLIPDTLVQALAIDNGKLMSTIMGGILVGLGIGISVSQGGSTGGTDIIALIVNKYRNVSPGRMILFLDAAIILSSLIVPSYLPDGSLMPFVDKITTVVYGFILITISTTVLDMYLSGTKQSVQVFITSSKYAQIADAITKEMHRGVTVLNGMGWYTQQPAEVLMVLTRKTDLNLLLRYVKTIDPNAFLSVSSVTGVYGKGFDQIKGKSK